MLSRDFVNALLWLAGGTASFLVALNWAPAVFVDGQILPTGHDSFYHARRILDAVNAPAGPFDGLYQFDARIHVPEGSWVTWPWGYDFTMAAAIRAAIALWPVSPELALVYVPALWVYVNAALVVGIARALNLGPVLVGVALGCFALSPLTQTVHGLGRIDHHYVEHFFTLASLWLGMRWLEQPERVGRAALHGAVLGIAPAFYNGLFILVLPVLALLALSWLRQATLPAKGTLAWMWGLGLGTLAAVWPSEPFRAAMFDYYLLSWFHVYVAAAAGLAALALHRLPRAGRSAAILAAIATLLAYPLLGQFRDGLDFVSASIPGLSEMTEAHSLWTAVTASPVATTRQYSGLLWLLPLTLLWQLRELRREERPAMLYFHCVCLFGAALMLQQHRFHQYGSFALYLPLLVALVTRWPGPGKTASCIGVAVAVAAYVPVLPTLTTYPVPGFSGTYYLTRHGYGPMAAACRDDPGTVLADPHDGHYVRYHTECPVIANNFLINDQHVEKAALARSLLSASVGELRARAPWVKYLWLIREDNVLDPSLSIERVRRANPGLRELLFHTGAPPPGLELLWEGTLPGAGERSVVARLYRLTGRATRALGR